MKFSSREAILMLAPVAVLGLFGWLLRARKPADITPQGPFQPFIKRVTVLPARPVDVFDGYDTRVVVELDARGRLPSWWNTEGHSYYSGDGGQLVSVKGDKTTSLGRKGHRESPHQDFQHKYKGWISTYNLKLREIPSSAGQVRLRDTVEFTDNSQRDLAKLWLDSPVRVSGATTKMPSVSRVPGVKLTRFSLEPTPPIESHDGIERWRVRWYMQKNVPRTENKTDYEGINVDVPIVNRAGDRVGSVGVSTYRQGDEDDDAQYKSYVPGVSNTPVLDPRKRMIRDDYALDLGGTPIPLKEPLWLQGSIRNGDKWPLAIKIPLRDADGKMLFTPSAATPPPFRVLTITQVKPHPDEVATWATDSIVSVVLQAWNPKATAADWNWQGDYSQHLRAASGKSLWEFPFKTGKGVIGASYTSTSATKQLFEIRYMLALKGIPAKEGKLVFHADISANKSRRVPVELTVRP